MSGCNLKLNSLDSVLRTAKSIQNLNIYPPLRRHKPIRPRIYPLPDLWILLLDTRWDPLDDSTAPLKAHTHNRITYIQSRTYNSFHAMTEVRTHAASVGHTAALFRSKAKWLVQERKRWRAKRSEWLKRAKGRFLEISSLNRYNIKLGLTHNPFSKKMLMSAEKYRNLCYWWGYAVAQLAEALRY
jgi:hypothetical protein